MTVMSGLLKNIGRGHEAGSTITRTME
jgi:hypothetical protein